VKQVGGLINNERNCTRKEETTHTTNNEYTMKRGTLKRWKTHIYKRGLEGVGGNGISRGGSTRTEPTEALKREAGKS
jgi:hypothetical protein